MIFKKPKFLSVKSVPKLFWSAPKALTISPPPISVLFLIVGLLLFGLGEALLVASGAGVSPWTVLAQGLSQVTNWSMGSSNSTLNSFLSSILVPYAGINGMLYFNASWAAESDVRASKPRNGIRVP